MYVCPPCAYIYMQRRYCAAATATANWPVNCELLMKLGPARGARDSKLTLIRRFNQGLMKRNPLPSRARARLHNSAPRATAFYFSFTYICKQSQCIYARFQISPERCIE